MLAVFNNQFFSVVEDYLLRHPLLVPNQTMCGYKRTLATPFRKLQIPVPNQIFSGQNRKPCDEKQLKKQPGDAAIKASSNF